VRTTFGQFIEYCRYQRNLSELTCAAYNSDFGLFREWILGRKDRITIDRIEPADIQAYIIHLRKSGSQQNTVLRKLNALSSFFDYCIKWHGLKVNPVKYCERGKKIKHKAMVPPQEMVDRVFTLVDLQEGPFHEVSQDRVVLMLFVTAGLRFSEVLSLTWERINFVEREIIVLGKGNKERKVPMLVNLYNALLKLKSAWESGGKKLEGPIVLNQYGKPAQRTTLRYLWKRYCCELEEQGFTFHSFRRYYATRLYRFGIGVVEIKELLGHEDLNTTLAYLEPSLQETKEKLKRIRI